jgi:hypothetical protein
MLHVMRVQGHIMQKRCKVQGALKNAFRLRSLKHIASLVLLDGSTWHKP